MKMNMAVAGTVCSSLAVMLRIVTLRRRSEPSTLTTSLSAATLMLPVAWIRSTKYCDMASSIDAPRTRMVTVRA